MPIQERKRQQRMKTIRNILIIFILMLSIGFACLALYKFLFNEEFSMGKANPLESIEDELEKIDENLTNIENKTKSVITTSSDQDLEHTDYDEIPTTIQSEFMRQYTDKIKLKFNSESCGPPLIAQRVGHGEIAQLNQFPWVAALFYSSNGTSIFGCGGSLISENLILTAAHCLGDHL
jgi:uncharacterized protein YxeA